MLFEFNLIPLEEVVPWGRGGQPALHWFGLTDGHYWMQAGESTLFEYSDAARAQGAPRFCNYQVARLYEDIVYALPHVLEPVPTELIPSLAGPGRRRTFERLSAWIDGTPERDDEAYWATVDHAITWVGQRELSTSHLSPSVDLAIWSDDASVHIEWDNRDKSLRGVPAWSALSGSCSLPRAEFVAQLNAFHSRFMAAMSERVRCVAAGALAPGIDIDVPALIQEHAKRASWALGCDHLPSPTDWSAVRSALKEIRA